MNIIELAKEAGFPFNKYGLLQGDEQGEIDAEAMLERFAAFVLKAEADETRARFTQPERAEREWVDLTDDEIDAVLFPFDRDSSFEDIAQTVIAAFKEKNK